MVLKQELDYVLVPLGLAIMASYHIWLLHRFIKCPTKTVIGINAVNRKLWVQTMMQDQSKNGILSVQTLRNNIMASTLLASMAIALSSVIALLMANGYGSNNNTTTTKDTRLTIYGDYSELGVSLKYLSILVCFLLAFFLNVQSVRYYSHTCILINVPVSRFLSTEFVGSTLNRAGYFWSLGLRVFYFSFPLFLWFLGPIPMFISCVFLVFLFYFLDIAFSSDEKVDVEKEMGEEEEEGV